MERTHSFGYWLRRRRKALDLTQAELAERVSCSLDLIQKIETDARRPSRQLAERLADSLGVDATERVAFVQAARAERSADQLDMPSEPVAPHAGALPQGTITFLFTDIDGSSRLWEQHPRAMPTALARHDALLQAIVTAHGGVVFKTVGDSVLAAFAQAPGALAVALAAQRAISTEAWDLPEPPRVRMALHSGSAESRNGDYFGPALNRAARLLDAGHGAQVLLSLASEQLVREHLPPEATLRDLGSHRLKDLSLPEQIFQLVAPDLPATFPTLNTLDARHTNLLAQPTALIGREQEVAAVATLMRRADARIVTLTGPGGVGKTRLSLQVAAELLDDFADGVYFVDLAPIREADLVTSAIVATLGVRERAGQPLLAQLQEFLRDKRLLLLLDNFEQVLDAAPLVAALLAAAPQVKALVTSRAALHLRGEKDVAVAPLALPDRAELPPLEQLAQYAAVALFIARAVDARADFQVTDATAPAVAELCAQLDGLPLAIELAASRLKLFSPEALLARLSGRLALLSGGARDLPARQQTIRNTIAWSYDLLSAREQQLLARLGVFVGGWTLEAAEAVCGMGDPAGDVEAGLTTLVDHNLVRPIAGVDGEPRFVMLETIREYALEQLAARGAAAAVRRAHAAYYLVLAEDAEQRLRGPDQLVWLQRLEREHANLLAVLAWSRAAPEGAATGLRLAGALWWLWTYQGYFQEGRGWLRDVLALPGAQAPTAVRGKALASAGHLAWVQSDHHVARALLTEAEAIGRATADRAVLVFALRGLTFVAEYQGDPAASMAYAEEGLALSRALGARWDEAQALLSMAMYTIDRGEYPEARRLGEASLALFRATGDSLGRASNLVFLGSLSLAVGEYARAAALLDESLACCRAAGNRGQMADALAVLGHLARAQGDDGHAAAHYRESLDLYRAVGDKAGIAAIRHNQAYLALHQHDPLQAAALLTESLLISREINREAQIAYDLATMGGVAVAQEEPDRAARLLGAAEAWFTTVGNIVGQTERAEHDGYIAAARAQLGEAAFAAAWEAGQALTLEQAIAEALGDAADVPHT